MCELVPQIGDFLLAEHGGIFKQLGVTVHVS